MHNALDIPLDLTVDQFQRDFLDHLRALRGVDLDAASLVDCYHAWPTLFVATCSLAPLTRDAPRSAPMANGPTVCRLSGLAPCHMNRSTHHICNGLAGLV